MLFLTDGISLVPMSAIEGPETPSKRRLIAAGERLLGERGFNGTSLQDIALEAGHANKYAIQYHFGSKEGLIQAILALRLRWIDRRREGLLQQAGTRGLLSSVPALFEALYLPVAEQVDEGGRHSFARFRLQYFARPDYDRFEDPLVNPGKGPTQEIARHLSAALKIDPAEAVERFHILGFVALAALIDRDNRIAHGREAPSLEEVLVRSRNIAAGALAHASVTVGA